jgi:hypothetical protein
MVERKVTIIQKMEAEEFAKVATNAELAEVGRHALEPNDAVILFKEVIKRAKEGQDPEGNLLFRVGEDWHLNNLAYEELYETIKKIPLGLVQIVNKESRTKWEVWYKDFNKADAIETLKSFKPSDFKHMDDWEFFQEEVYERWGIEV